FVRLEPGIEALLHSSQVGNPTVDLEHYVRQGQHLLLRIISIEADRQRLGLSLKEVTEAERENFAIEHGYEVDDITFYVPPYEGEDEEEYEGGDDDDAVVESETEEATV